MHPGVCNMSRCPRVCVLYSNRTESTGLLERYLVLEDAHALFCMPALLIVSPGNSMYLEPSGIWLLKLDVDSFSQVVEDKTAPGTTGSVERRGSET